MEGWNLSWRVEKSRKVCAARERAQAGVILSASSPRLAHLTRLTPETATHPPLLLTHPRDTGTILSL